MNLKYTGILTALAISAVMAQDAVPATEVAAPTAPETSEAKFANVEQELAPENMFAQPAAVRGADAAKPVSSKKSKRFVYKPDYTPSEVEHHGRPVKTVYVTEKPTSNTIDMDQLRGLVPWNFTFGLQGFVGSTFLSGDNGRYEYDRYYGLVWSVGAFALFPLDEYNMAFKTGVFFEHDKVSNSYRDVFNEKYGEYRVSFSQYHINIPLLLSLKSAKSSMYFDVGVQPAFSVSDKLKVRSSDKSTSFNEDMQEEEYRQGLDWSIVLGFGIRANRYVGFDARFSWGLNNQYDNYNKWPVNNLSAKSITVGATFYAF